MERANRLRKQLPPIYNPARLNEQPIPQIMPFENEEEVEVVNNIGDDLFGCVETEHDARHDEQLNNITSEEDVKPVVVLDGVDLAVFGNLLQFDVEEPRPVENEVDPLTSNEGYEVVEQIESFSNKIESARSVSLHINDEIAHKNQEEIAHENPDADAEEVSNNVEDDILAEYGEKVIIDDELEFIHIPGQVLQPIVCAPTYKTKVNDELCGKVPFKENVCII